MFRRVFLPMGCVMLTDLRYALEQLRFVRLHSQGEPCKERSLMIEDCAQRAIDALSRCLGEAEAVASGDPEDDDGHDDELAAIFADRAAMEAVIPASAPCAVDQ